MTDPIIDPVEEDEDAAPVGATTVEIVLDASDAGVRLDKALADKAGELSRARLQALMDQGALTLNGQVLKNPSAKAQPGTYRIEVPPLVAARPEPEDIALTILFEDAHLIVIDKAAGMAVHPAPGNETGTLVNALLHHCAGSLSGVGGVARPGIVHRLDKDTSGVMVAAKSDVAHRGLSALFESHDIERSYIALVRGAPQPRVDQIVTRIARSPHDRKKMAVVNIGGRESITNYVVEAMYGPTAKPFASRVACRLETGRTHQIRVHMSSRGSPCLGDPVYGSGSPVGVVREAIAASGLNRQALHAAVLGFDHPVTGEALRFETNPPKDMATLQSLLSDL